MHNYSYYIYIYIIYVYIICIYIYNKNNCVFVGGMITTKSNT